MNGCRSSEYRTRLTDPLYFSFLSFFLSVFISYFISTVQNFLKRVLFFSDPYSTFLKISKKIPTLALNMFSFQLWLYM